MMKSRKWPVCVEIGLFRRPRCRSRRGSQHPDGRVDGPGDERRAVGRDVEIENIRRMDVERTDQPQAGKIPDPDGAVGAAGKQSFPVGTEPRRRQFSRERQRRDGRP